jgi:hypothetical protein
MTVTYGMGGNMSYREEQREKAIALRDAFFKDPGNGMFFGKKREFVLSEPSGNLWGGIREDAIQYFSRNKVSWWQGAAAEPTGHLLSSQIACLNHLYFIRQRPDVATVVLQGLDAEVETAEMVDDGFVEFEFIGEKKYLGERSFTRGANCTSVDAAMIGRMKDGKKKLFLIEWKYTEVYSNEDKYIPERSSVYDDLIIAEDSPFESSIKPSAFYFEPFYQLMRQTLLGQQCARHADHGVSDYVHVHVVPEKNKELLGKITSPELSGKNIHDVWEKVLKDKLKFIHTTPEKLLTPVLKLVDTKAATSYLQQRYWD